MRFEVGAAAYTRESEGSRLDMGRTLLMPVPDAGIATMTRPFAMETSYLRGRTVEVGGGGEEGGGGGVGLDEAVYGGRIEHVACWRA
jgi:hypothetical protein